VTTFGLSFRTERADAGKVSYPDSAAANVPWVTAFPVRGDEPAIASPS